MYLTRTGTNFVSSIPREPKRETVHVISQQLVLQYNPALSSPYFVSNIDVSNRISLFAVAPNICVSRVSQCMR